MVPETFLILFILFELFCRFSGLINQDDDDE